MKKIAILGLGKVGTLVAILLNDTKFKVTAFDLTEKNDLPFKTIQGDITDGKFLMDNLKNYDAVVSCLPYHLNKNIVKIAFELGIHYFDLTEDVPTSNYCQELSENARAVMAPQCGLAPGFIAIAGANLANRFDKLRTINLRVGALPQHPDGDLGYAFNWSPEGVVNEYINDCEVIKDGQIKMVPAMQDLENIIISGKNLEAFTTSGGLGTMCQTYENKVENLSYKTMRYPGHMKLMRFYFHELLMKENRELAGKILVDAKPPVSEDVVYVHASAEGWKEGELCRDEFVRAYYPKEFAGKKWRAISWTTACSIASTIEMVENKILPNKGFIKQEEISLDKFLSTQNGRYYAS